jgi:hypothetical protein
MRMPHTFAIIVGAAILLFCHPTRVVAEIRIENDTGESMYVYLKGLDDRKYRGPYKVAAQSQVEIPITPGKYFVATHRPGGGFDYLGWHDYSRNKITYRIALCSACRLVSGGDTKNDPVPVLRMDLSHADGSYRCPACGREHTRWVPGWGDDGQNDRPGTVDAHGAMRPDLDVFGTFRLGVSIIDSSRGVMVISTDERSPAHQMRRVGAKENGTIFKLTPAINVITHVNGHPVKNATEFSSAVAKSGKRITLTVFNSERDTSRDYWTILRE